MAQVFLKKEVAKPTRIKKKRRNSKLRNSFFLILLLILFIHLPQLLAYYHHHREFSSRKTIFFEKATPWFHDAVSVASELKIGANKEEGSFYYEEKRIIHTGPNPLHN